VRHHQHVALIRPTALEIRLRALPVKD